MICTRNWGCLVSCRPHVTLPKVQRFSVIDLRIAGACFEILINHLRSICPSIWLFDFFTETSFDVIYLFFFYSFYFFPSFYYNICTVPELSPRKLCFVWLCSTYPDTDQGLGFYLNSFIFPLLWHFRFVIIVIVTRDWWGRLITDWKARDKKKKKATDFFVTDLYVIFIYLRIRPRQRIIIIIARSLLKHNKLTFTCWLVTCHLHTQLLKNSGQRITLIERKRGTSSSIRLPTGEALMFS